MDFGDIDIGSVLNLSSSDFIPTSLRQNIDGLQDDITNSVNLTAYKDYLSEDQEFDIQDLFDNLTTLATHFNSNMVQSTTTESVNCHRRMIIIQTYYYIDGCPGKLHVRHSRQFGRYYNQHHPAGI